MIAMGLLPRSRPTSTVPTDEPHKEGFSRREALQVGAAGIAGLGVGMTPAVAEARRKKKKADGDPPPKNPYGARPGGGISLPDYYKPWPAIKNRNLYAPGHRNPAEERDADFVPWQHAVPGVSGAVGHVHAGRARQRDFTTAPLLLRYGRRQRQEYDRTAGPDRVGQRPLH